MNDVLPTPTPRHNQRFSDDDDLLVVLAETTADCKCIAGATEQDGQKCEFCEALRRGEYKAKFWKCRLPSVQR
jgi:hypothetical protein